MYRTFVLLFVIILQKSEGANKTNCDGYQANFNLKKVIGPWFVAAIIPEIQFPYKDITCYQVEFSETDQAGLKWLMNKTVNAPGTQQKQYDANGVVVRQRYLSDHAVDVWSKSVDGVNGCFHQMLSLDINNNKFHEALTKTAMMQLHMMNNDKSGPFLLQMLWGKLISVVIYSKQQGITQEQLKPAFELMVSLRGPQRLPRICNDRIRGLSVF